MSPIPSLLETSLSGRYHFQSELGRGGMATVYLAEDLKHRRKVAIKVMLPELSAAIGRDRFLREIEIAARLTHPHILPLHDSGAAGELLYYVTPYIEGESLRARLNRERQLPMEEALRLAREIASALGYAHQHGLVHRDVKPENVLLAEGFALVSDFGIARFVSSSTISETAGTVPGEALTSDGVPVGTPRYMAPEQAGGGEVDGRSDLYALGCVLYEMLAGQPPFTSRTANELIRQHLAEKAPSVGDLRPSVPAGVARVIARALAKLPADRPETAARFAEELGMAAGGGPMAVPPAAEGLERVPNNMPRERTQFIGRARELAECARLLEEARLLTLTGIGGSGKTRLALRLAGDRLAAFPDGVWFVDLAPLKDPGHVIPTTAAVLGVRETPGTPLIEAVLAHVASQRVLVILDNCEHVLGACVELVDRLLSTGSNLRILVTSREGLGVDGERTFPLRSLGVPPPTTTDLQAIGSADAVRLFIDRSRAVDPHFALTDKSGPIVAEICRRLDGIPLAIELAAARIKILSPEQIHSRLDDRFRLLTGGSKTALPRHQTLLATIGWSYDALSADEQKLLRALSVFVGGWTLPLATRVSGHDADEFQVMDLLAGLADKSLVVVERSGETDTRYTLLETVRQFAQEKLAEAGEATAVRQRFLDELLALAESAYDRRIHREDHWSARLETEHDNLRVALDLARNTDPEKHLDLAGALSWFWQIRSHLKEGGIYLREALNGVNTLPPRPAMARALLGMARITAWQGDGDVAVPMIEEALAMWRALGNTREEALTLEALGYAQWLGGRDEAARDTFRASLELNRQSGDPVLINRARVGLAQVLVSLHELAETRSLSNEILSWARSVNDARSEHFATHYLADCALIEGRCQESLRLYRQSLALAHPLGDQVETCFELHGIAMSLAGLDRIEEALRFNAAITAHHQRLGVDFHVRFWDQLLKRYLEPARQQLSAMDRARVEEEGRKWSFEEMVEEGMKGVGGRIEGWRSTADGCMKYAEDD